MLRILILSACLAAFACSHNGPGPTSAGGWTADDVLAFVPAESPYVLGQLDPMDEATRAHAFGLSDGSLKTMTDALADRSADDPIKRAFIAYVAEVSNVPVAKRGDSIGLAHDFRFVIYGDPIYPVARLAVSDPVRLRVVLHKIATAFGPGIVEHAESVPYWTFAKGKVTVVVAMHDRDLTTAVFPTEETATRLPPLLANTRPAHSLRESADVPALLARHQLRRELFAIIDVAKVAVQLARYPGTGLDSPQCKDDLARVAAVVPRLVAGYHANDPKRMDLSFVVELPPAIADSLSKLRVALPVLSKDPLMTMGIGLDVDRALAVATDLAGRVRDQQFACAPLATLNKVATAALVALANVPPQIHGLRGFAFALDDMQMEPRTYSGVAIVLGSQLQKVIQQLPLGLAIPSDGHPVPLPVEMLGIKGLSSAHAAMSGDRLAIGAGDHSADLATSALAAKDEPQPALMTFAMSAHWFATHIESMRTNKSFELFDDLWAKLDVRDDGLVFDFGGTWAR
jgi:hypothetical protein